MNTHKRPANIIFVDPEVYDFEQKATCDECGMSEVAGLNARECNGFSIPAYCVQTHSEPTVVCYRCTEIHKQRHWPGDYLIEDILRWIDIHLAGILNGPLITVTPTEIWLGEPGAPEAQLAVSYHSKTRRSTIHMPGLEGWYRTDCTLGFPVSMRRLFHDDVRAFARIIRELVEQRCPELEKYAPAVVNRRIHDAMTKGWQNLRKTWTDDFVAQSIAHAFDACADSQVLLRSAPHLAPLLEIHPNVALWWIYRKVVPWWTDLSSQSRIEDSTPDRVVTSLMRTLGLQNGGLGMFDSLSQEFMRRCLKADTDRQLGQVLRFLAFKRAGMPSEEILWEILRGLNGYGEVDGSEPSKSQTGRTVMSVVRASQQFRDVPELQKLLADDFGHVLKWARAQPDTARVDDWDEAVRQAHRAEDLNGQSRSAEASCASLG